MAIELTDEMADEINNALANNMPCLVATAGEDGEPDVAFRGSMMVYDNEHLAFWERSRIESLENLRFNPKVCVFFRNPQSRDHSWRFYGVATIYEEGEMRQKIMDRVVQRELDQDPERKGFGVLIRVDRVRQRSAVIMELD
jgi:general stress protein 26